MTYNHKQARKWRRAFRQELPPTETALTAAMKELLRRRPEWMSDDAKETLNAVTIEALAEAAAADGDLRAALEEALERTVWSSTSAPQLQAQTMVLASNYGAVVAQQVPDLHLRQAFYRSGLKLDSCLAIRDEIAPKLDRIVAALTSHPVGEELLENLLHWLIAKLVKALAELSDLRGAEPAQLRDALTKWMLGASESDIEKVHPKAWEVLTPRQLETMIPWALTGAFEIIAALADDLQLREAAHRRLSPVRIRDGVPRVELCDLVRAAADRVQVARIAAEYEAESDGGWFALNLRDAVEHWLEEEAAREQADEAREDASQGTTEPASSRHENAPVEGTAPTMPPLLPEQRVPPRV